LGRIVQRTSAQSQEDRGRIAHLGEIKMAFRKKRLSAL
jgi:hypothetical protein